jgi:tyrosine ammonia-lyase
MPVWPLSDAEPLTLHPHETVTLGQFATVAMGTAPVTLGAVARLRMEESRRFLAQLIVDETLIYGITTGYGPLANQYIAPEQCRLLQQNLIFHLSAGVGPLLSPLHTRAVLLARLVSLSKGHSAIRPETAAYLSECLNHDILPSIPSMGTVGASGDLTPLAHMTLALMGDARAQLCVAGQLSPADVAWRDITERLGLEPLKLDAKEGLALVNGTSAMTGIAAINGIQGNHLFSWALRLSQLYAEVMGAKAEAYHPHLAMVRPHPGQLAVTQYLQQGLYDTQRLELLPSSRARLSRPDVNDAGIAHGQPLLQDPYTLRCLPQIYGAVYDVLHFHNQTVETELNAVTDNPVFFPEDDLLLHGGNFYGQHVAFASDTLALAVVKMAIHAERVVARVTDVTLNKGLPAFLQAQYIGLQSGFMGAQVTASALVAEMRSLATPASIQSIPTNGNNQDVVTMGTIAARKTAQLIEHLAQLLAIEALVLTQAFELRGGWEARLRFSTSSEQLAAEIRDLSDALVEDRPLSGDIARVARFILTGS